VQSKSLPLLYGTEWKNLHVSCFVIFQITKQLILEYLRDFKKKILNRQILLNVIPVRRKVWTKQDTNGAAYRRYTITI